MSDGLIPFSGSASLLSFDKNEDPRLPDAGAANEVLVSDGSAWSSEEKPGVASTIWFEWNGTDLSQFDTKVEGDNVTSSTIQVTSAGGFNWIDMSVAGTGAGNSIDNGVVLPISTTPPSTDYVIAFEFISIVVDTDIVSAGALVRYVSLEQAYWCRYNNRSDDANMQQYGKFEAGPTLTKYDNMSDPDLDGTYRGVRLALAVEGTGSGAFVRMIVGEPSTYMDTSPHDDVGKAALWQTANVVGGPVQNYYRNIKCYTIDAVTRFEL